MPEKQSRLEELFSEMRAIQQHFLEFHAVNDIWSNSKIYEVLQANTLGHKMIPGHSGSLDASDHSNRDYEYKHFKETSSNHSWTFNDYSDETIKKLSEKVHAVVFAHINDEVFPPILDWTYEATGGLVANYLTRYTVGMTNARRMINISAKQLDERTTLRKKMHNASLSEGLYGRELVRIFALISELEATVGVTNILTSNKFWEVLVSLPLGHTVNSEQGGRAGAHDAFDENGADYEYKVSSSKSWNFQDISPAVLKKYHHCEEIILAIVDKTNINVEEVWMAKPEFVVPRLEQKLAAKAATYAEKNKEVRRLQVSLSSGDLALVGARKII
jgi:hypothetical protein